MVSAVTLEELKENVDIAKREYLKATIRLDRFYRMEQAILKNKQIESQRLAAITNADYEATGYDIGVHDTSSTV